MVFSHSVSWWLCVTTCLAAAIGSADAASFDPKAGWQQLKSPHFMVYYSRDLAPVAQRAADLAEEAHVTLSPKYHWKPLGRTVVVLTDNNDESNGLATVLPYNYLLLRVTAPPPESVLAYYDDWLRLLIMHEYLHIIHMDQARGIMKVPRLVMGKTVSPNGILPGWMREGLAVHEESLQTRAGRARATVSDMMLRTDVLQDDWKAIDEADGLGWRWPKFLPRYLYGGEFLDWLGKKYGEDSLVKFQRRTAGSPIFFMHNHHAKRVWGKTLYRLWRDWRNETAAHYRQQIAAIEAAGVTPLTTVANAGEINGALAVAPDGSALVYTSSSPHRKAELRFRDLTDGSERVLRTALRPTAAAFHPRGHQVAFSALGRHRRYNYFSDIYLYDLARAKVFRVTNGRRARDPSFSPTGDELLYVVEKGGEQWLARYHLATKKETIIPIERGPRTQFSRPRWSPDGRLIAVSSWRDGQHDLYLYYPNGLLARRLTNDRAVDATPVWSADGSTLYFGSDRSGVANIYRYDLRRQRVARVTNVPTGVFEPQPAPDGSLYLQYYHGEGYDIRQATVGRAYSMTLAEPFADSSVERSAGSVDRAAVAQQDFPTRSYNPLTPHLFLPRYMVPNVIGTGSGVLLSATTGAFDPLRWHNWMGGVTYRTDAGHVGYFFNYFYNRYRPIINVGVMNYAVDFGNLTFLSSSGTRTVRMYEKRTRGFAGAGYAVNNHQFRLNYFLEQRDNVPALSTAERSLLNLDRFAGVSATYSWGKGERYPASISTEKGHRVLANLTVTDNIFGASERNEQRIATVDLREYIALPWRHHVLALRAKGGWTWGDRLVQGTFALGGDLGEGNLGGGGSLYYFPLRGLPVSSLSRSRAALASMEYRIPLVSPQRGLGTWPLFVENLHAAVFADYGNAWNTNETNVLKNFFLGTGVEVRGDFVIGHGLPVVGRLGYGIVVANRDRLGAITDPLLGTPARNGVFIMQWGTSF
ncbi:MAG: PD40 domain-containing protein [Deltaproteobacteria bacterium]|nr:PD40 domain-containing protein [Deltaproteobacteria bacterium]